MNRNYFDIHSHVAFRDYDQDLPEVLARMEEEGVWTITVGVDKKSSEEAVAFAEGKENFFAGIGLHPTDTAPETFSESEYKSLGLDPKVVAIGECGLDYYRGPAFADAATAGEERKRQKREFGKQLEFALKYDKALMIHCRPSKGTVDAYEDLLIILEHAKKEAGERLRGDIHFFVGTPDVARRFWALGFTTSFTGVLTFTHDYDAVVKAAPLSMLLAETDAPYVAPAPFRGRRNEPSYVKYVVEAISRIRGEDIGAVRAALFENAVRLFRL